MNRFFSKSILLAMVLSSIPLLAADKIDETKTPWLKGVTLDKVPAYITPVLPMKFYLKNGEPIPKVVKEDEPLYVQVDSNIFFDDVPTKDRNYEIPNPAWEEAFPSINWKLINWEINKNVSCKSTTNLPLNCMIVVPVSPTKRGAIYCDAARKLSYDVIETGERTKTFANSSGAKDIEVKDITPPTCGLEITVEGGHTGSVFPIENPPDKFPLPKTADLVMQGPLFNGDNDYQEILSGYVLGPDMIAPDEQAAVYVERGDVVKLSVIGDDNYKLDKNKLKFGICSGAGGEPTPVCEENQPEYDLAGIKLPEKPYFYLDATDVEGNREVLFIPIKIK